MAKPPTVTVRGRELPVCSHGECEEARIWDYATCWEHLKDAERENIRERPSDALRQKESLSGIILTGADLSGFDFTAADLSGAHLDKCRLRTSKFVEANLRRAYLGWSNLDNTDLSRAELDRCVFTNCSLENVRLLAYSISFGREPINLEATLFGAAKLFRRPHIDESHPWSAEATYRALKSYFIREADYESASWASYCEKTMQRKVLWQGDKRHWLVSAFLAISCGYGEKPLRVIATAGWVVIIFGVLFYSYIAPRWAGRSWVGSRVSISALRHCRASLSLTFCLPRAHGSDYSSRLKGRLESSCSASSCSHSQNDSSQGEPARSM